MASHTDIEDQGQTVDYPEHEIKTTAKDKDTQKSEGIAKKNATIIDTVSYSGLIMGQEYTVKGVVILNEETTVSEWQRGHRREDLCSGKIFRIRRYSVYV